MSTMTRHQYHLIHSHILTPKHSQYSSFLLSSFHPIQVRRRIIDYSHFRSLSSINQISHPHHQQNGQVQHLRQRFERLGGDLQGDNLLRQDHPMQILHLVRQLTDQVLPEQVRWKRQ